MLSDILCSSVFISQTTVNNQFSTHSIESNIFGLFLRVSPTSLILVTYYGDFISRVRVKVRFRYKVISIIFVIWYVKKRPTFGTILWYVTTWAITRRTNKITFLFRVFQPLHVNRNKTRKQKCPHYKNECFKTYEGILPMKYKKPTTASTPF